jgi:hypothetical protein
VIAVDSLYKGSGSRRRSSVTRCGCLTVMLTYDWSRVPPHHRDIEFPPFGRQHLDNSLKHLAELAERV